MSLRCAATSDVPLPVTAWMRANRPGARGGSLLAIVLILHAVLLVFVLTASVSQPLRKDAPLMVDFMETSAPIETAAPRAVSASKPETRTTLPRQAPRKAGPVAKPASTTVPLETTSATGQAEQAPANAPSSAASESSTASVTGASAPSGKGESVEVVGARFDADYLKNPAPPYPAVSRRMREEGKVVLRVAVTPAGTADNVDVKTSSGSERLDEAALRAVRQWKFVPARRGDTPVASFVLVPILFKLEQ
jgi:protein TonB